MPQPVHFRAPPNADRLDGMPACRLVRDAVGPCAAFPPSLQSTIREPPKDQDQLSPLKVSPSPAPLQCATDRSNQVVTSLGSAGHPATCGSLCKYARRKTGCRNG